MHFIIVCNSLEYLGMPLPVYRISNVFVCVCVCVCVRVHVCAFKNSKGSSLTRNLLFASLDSDAKLFTISNIAPFICQFFKCHKKLAFTKVSL